MAEKKITAADLKAAHWTPELFASGRNMHIRDYTCAEFPRVVLREQDERTATGWTHRQTMVVDGKDVGGSAAAADALNAQAAGEAADRPGR